MSSVIDCFVLWVLNCYWYCVLWWLCCCCCWLWMCHNHVCFFLIYTVCCIDDVCRCDTTTWWCLHYGWLICWVLLLCVGDVVCVGDMDCCQLCWLWWLTHHWYELWWNVPIQCWVVVGGLRMWLWIVGGCCCMMSCWVNIVCLCMCLYGFVFVVVWLKTTVWVFVLVWHADVCCVYWCLLTCGRLFVVLVVGHIDCVIGVVWCCEF